MIKIAIISDIHANLPALEAVLEAIDTQKPEAIFCLGDLVNQNVWNNEVVDLIRGRKIRTVVGNHDNGIAHGKRHFSFSYTFPEAYQWGIEAIGYTLRTIRKENQEFLASLPLRLRLGITQKDGRQFIILLVHANPFDLEERLYRYTSKDRFREILEKVKADMLISGHTHCPYHHILSLEENNETVYRHVLNPGSVGRPKDGDWRPSYVLLTLDDQKPLQTDAGAVKVDFYRVKYDLGRAVKAIRKSELSVYYGSCLITG